MIGEIKKHLDLLTNLCLKEDGSFMKENYGLNYCTLSFLLTEVDCKYRSKEKALIECHYTHINKQETFFNEYYKCGYEKNG